MDKNSEEYRHFCEVNYLISLRHKSKKETYDFLNLVKEKRGMEKYLKLKNDAKLKWDNLKNDISKKN